MPQFSQANRPIRVETALGEDVLLLAGFTGSEAVSKPFTLQLDLLSENEEIAPEDVLRTAMIVTVRQADGGERKIHGLVRSFGQLGQHETLTSYRAEIVPWFWFLSLSRDCRIFQGMDVLEIVQQVFADQGYSDFEIRCNASYPRREYCVQYRESHLDFVSRLLEDEGIFYFFEHSAEKHVLVLADANSVAEPCPGPKEVRIRTMAGPEEDHIATLEREHSVHTGTVSLTDYDYLQPPLSLDASLSGGEGEEVFDYRSRWYSEQDQGERRARLLLEEMEARRHVVFGRGSCRHFRSGHTFELTGHYRRDMNRKYLLLQVGHSVRAGSYRSWDDAPLDHDVSFVAIPVEVPFRPPPGTPKPVVHGSQTAEVVGKSGEEIWTDQHGRIKVQFHWDRVGGRDEKSSCWIRLATRWAGKSWGEIHLPRIGQEVLVDFIEGDPDHPIITGAVYNADQPPPFPLPGQQTRSGMKSRSSKGGGGYNEISIDDRKGEELVHIHAQKDKDVVVENDRTESVGHDETISIGNDRTETVGNNETITIGADRTELVQKNETITVVLTRTRAVGVNESVNVGGAQEVTVGGIRSVAVGINQAVEVGNDESIDVGSDQTVSVGKNRTTSVGEEETLTVGKKILIDAGDEITIKTGKASLVMKKDGTIQISGKDITVKGSGKIDVKASKNITMKGKKILQN